MRIRVHGIGGHIGNQGCEHGRNHAWANIYQLMNVFIPKYKPRPFLLRELKVAMKILQHRRLHADSPVNMPLSALNHRVAAVDFRNSFCPGFFAMPSIDYQ